MKLYNSYTQQIEDFVPMEEGKVRMYVCGPTVYNDPHIGNARPIVVFDTLKKTLEALGYDVTYASNYTDVDDKIINRAIEENKTEKEITDTCIESFRKVRKDLNAQDPDYTPRVTETMDHIIGFIGELVDHDAAYQKDGDVYYRVSSDDKYGELSHQKMEDLMVGARVEENEKKENPLDFTLWKQTDKGIQWDSPWGKGRPGWHTECVVMINDVFGQPLIDIHGGGSDLRFPHHENEMAQSRSVSGTPLANYWVHNGMINVDGIKMSKSKGNFRLAKDLISEFGGPACRWILISTHYRSPLNITNETMEMAQNELAKIKKPMKQALMKMALEGITPSPQAKDELLWQEFLAAMSDDLNTPNAIAVLMKGIKKLNTLMRSREIDYNEMAEVYSVVAGMLDVLGIDLDLEYPSKEMVDTHIAWKQAVKEKNFEKADQLRAVLMDQGWI